jgi:hypothetical protein
MTDESGIDVYLSLDVGKGDHHATAVNRAGKKVLDKPLPNSEPRLRELFDRRCHVVAGPMPDGVSGRDGFAVGACGQSMAGWPAAPVIWSQMAKRMVISAR